MLGQSLHIEIFDQQQAYTDRLKALTAGPLHRDPSSANSLQAHLAP